MKGLRPFFVACLIVTALFAVLLLSIPQARADHEGPYIVGEEKDLTDTYYFACFEEEVALAALDIFEQFGYNPERLFLFDDVCGTLSGTVMVVGQIGEDVQVRGTNDVVRFIHALYTFERETFDVFIFTGGDAKLIQKR
ncbi:MAG: hypothetical protein HY457_02490 [Parcubacteria group bacterium]|nr:hypothetical protein [Parcubacteria group bacterium]